VVEHGGFVYDSDSYADDLPYWTDVDGASHLVVPYALDTNDMRFATPQGFNTGEHFFTYCRDAFDVLYAEGASAPGGAKLRLGGQAGGAGRRGESAVTRPQTGHVQVQRASGPWIAIANGLTVSASWMSR